MLRIEKDWGAEEVKIKIVEYRSMDFFGPFLTLELKQYKDGTIIITPVSIKIETTEVSRSQFWLLSKATQELYRDVGDFILKTKFFDVKINSEQTEELILQKLKDIKLF